VKIHPGEEMLASLRRSVDGAGPRVLEHLAGCARCRSRLALLPRHLQHPARDPAPVIPFRLARSESYDAAFTRSQSFVAKWASLMEHERTAAPDLFAELVERTGEQREILLRNSKRFRTWGLLELVAERSLEASVQNPGQGEELGRLALRIADFLNGPPYGEALVADLRARSWAYIGNARRVKSDLAGAEEAFEQGWHHLRKGTGDLLDRAFLIDLQASLKRDQRRFTEAFRLLRRAASLFFDLGERHRAGRSFVSLAIVHNQSGDPLEAAALTRRALQLIDPGQEPRLLLSARHNLVFYLASSGHFLEAQGAYREARSLYCKFPDAWTQNRRRWVKGKIARGLGQREQAEALFLAARDGFLAEGIPYDTALVSLEIALLYAEQGRTAELKRLAAGMVPIFASRQIHREALAALAFFRQAAESERAGVEVVEKVAAYLRKARYAPDLRFQKTTLP
jgi:tetratricopeptide (TPR) repeat protein